MVQAHTNQLTSEIRDSVASKMNWVRSRTQLNLSGVVIRDKDDRRLSEYGVTSDCVIQASVGGSVQSYPDIYDEGGYVYSSTGNQSKCPAVLMAGKNDYMRRLFELAESSDSVVREHARILLDALPTEPSETQAYEDSCNRPTLAMLRSLLPLDRLTPFKLSYKLQTLSNLLLPAVGMWSHHVAEARSFFVRNNGLGLLLEVLSCPRLRGSSDVQTKLSCFTTAFTLFKFLVVPELNKTMPRVYPPVRDTPLQVVGNLTYLCGLPQSALEPSSLHPLDAPQSPTQASPSARVLDLISAPIAGVLLGLFYHLIVEHCGDPEADVSEDSVGSALALEILWLLESVVTASPAVLRNVCNSEHTPVLFSGVIVGCHSKAVRICTARFAMFVVEQLMEVSSNHDLLVTMIRSLFAVSTNHSQK